MRAASQLPGRGPTVWMMPLHLHVNKKSDYDDDDVPSESFFSASNYQRLFDNLNDLLSV